MFKLNIGDSYIIEVVISVERPIHLHHRFPDGHRAIKSTEGHHGNPVQSCIPQLGRRPSPNVFFWKTASVQPCCWRVCSREPIRRDFCKIPQHASENLAFKSISRYLHENKATDTTIFRKRKRLRLQLPWSFCGCGNTFTHPKNKPLFLFRVRQVYLGEHRGNQTNRPARSHSPTSLPQPQQCRGNI